MFRKKEKFCSVRTPQLWYSTAVKTVLLWNSSIVLQFSYRVARLENSRAVGWLWSEAALGGGPSPTIDCLALICLLCSSPHQSALPYPALLSVLFYALVWWGVFFHVSSALFQLSQGNTVFSLLWKVKMHCMSQRGVTYIERSPHPWALIGLSSCKSSQFDWSKRHCPNWSEWSHTNWSVKMLMGGI